MRLGRVQCACPSPRAKSSRQAPTRSPGCGQERFGGSGAGCLCSLARVREGCGRLMFAHAAPLRTYMTASPAQASMQRVGLERPAACRLPLDGYPQVITQPARVRIAADVNLLGEKELHVRLLCPLNPDPYILPRTAQAFAYRPLVASLPLEESSAAPLIDSPSSCSRRRALAVPSTGLIDPPREFMLPSTYRVPTAL